MVLVFDFFVRLVVKTVVVVVVVAVVVVVVVSGVVTVSVSDCEAELDGSKTCPLLLFEGSAEGSSAKAVRQAVGTTASDNIMQSALFILFDIFIFLSLKYLLIHIKL